MDEHFILARLGIREVLEARYRAKGVQNGSFIGNLPRPPT